MRWLVDFRNITKGHGGPDESTSAPVLFPFHSVFLDLVSSLKEISFDAHLVRICKDGTEINLGGWLRGIRRSSILLRPQHRSLTTGNELRTQTETFAFEERVSIRVNEVLTWHGEKKSGEDAYVNYLSGEVRSLGT
jgi:hypothetical protein